MPDDSSLKVVGSNPSASNIITNETYVNITSRSLALDIYICISVSYINEQFVLSGRLNLVAAEGIKIWVLNLRNQAADTISEACDKAGHLGVLESPTSFPARNHFNGWRNQHLPQQCQQSSNFMMSKWTAISSSCFLTWTSTGRSVETEPDDKDPFVDTKLKTDEVGLVKRSRKSTWPTKGSEMAALNGATKKSYNIKSRIKNSST